MISYRVSFYNQLPDDTGHDHLVCQREIEVATSCEKEAVAKAIREFERNERVPNWRHRASEIKCIELPHPKG